MSWLFTSESELKGWFKALTISGAAAGLGFECERCRWQVRHSVQPGQKFFHCGAEHTAPRLDASLPTRRIGGAVLPSNMIPVFSTTEVPDRPEPEPPSEVQWT